MPDIFQSSSTQNKTPETPVVQSSQIQPQAAPAMQPNPVPATTTPTQTAASPLNIPQSGMNLFSTLSFNPDGIHFVNQEPDEDVILFFRADFITNFPWIF